MREEARLTSHHRRFGWNRMLCKRFLNSATDPLAACLSTVIRPLRGQWHASVELTGRRVAGDAMTAAYTCRSSGSLAFSQFPEESRRPPESALWAYVSCSLP